MQPSRSTPFAVQVRGHGLAVLAIACLVVLASGRRALPAQEPGPSTYPLDPLSREEITATAATLTQNDKVRTDTRVWSFTLHEPLKADVLAAAASGRPTRRMASVFLYDWRTGVAASGIVDPGQHAIVSWSERPSADPPAFYVAIMRATEIARTDPRFRAAMARRGYTNLSRIRVEPSVKSDYAIPRRKGDRVAQGTVFDQDALDMGRSRGLFGVTLWENLTRGTLDSLVDTAAVATLTDRADQAPGQAPGQAPEPASRAEHTENEGSSIEIRGSAVRWGRWQLRAAVDPRRGLELYDIAFVDGGTVRPVLYRASISEMIAPYGDPGFTSWYPMDEGDVGLGAYGLTSAVPGEDAPTRAAFLPAVFADDHGRAVELQRAAAVFERESDVQWRHGNVARHARELVVRGYCTADNYDYVFDWIFRDDGSIRVQVAPTGIINSYEPSGHHSAVTRGVASTISSHRVDARTIGPIHQHFFSYRLDFDIGHADHDRVIEMTPAALPVAPKNASGEWFAVQRRVLRTEQEVLRGPGATPGRWWLVASTQDTNVFGQPTGYALIPGDNALPYMSPTSAPGRRARFMAHELWVTPYSPEEMYAAGEVPSHDTVAQGLPRWTVANRQVDDRDVVVWYTLGLTHLPRTEDWPVMPTYPVGFRLLPAGFFAHDPALDAAPRRER